MSDSVKHIVLPYAADGRRWFDALCREPWSAWLDSGRPGPAAGRYDLFVARPHATLVSRGGESIIDDRGGTYRLRGDPLRHLRALLGERRPACPEAPFSGGAVGYFGYDLGRRRLGVAGADPALPVMAVGIYDWAVVTDHRTESTVLVGEGADRGLAAELERRWDEAAAGASGADAFRLTAGLEREPEGAAYAEAFRRVQEYIRAGDCYQVNLARRFSAPFEGDPAAGYLGLRGRGPAPFSAWLRLPFADVLSLSPERFLQLDGNRRVVTEPIKGTRPRGGDPVEDAAAERALCSSAKDRAENVMIVDLLRNDLGKSCETGSISVPSLFRPHRFANVHHLVSTVTGTLRPDRDALDLLGDCLPGGSVTGAPKRRAVEIIQELEPGPRGVYCGSIGYLGFDGRMDTNIAIRTAVCAGGRITYWAGGGIVADSDPAEELQETVDKAAAFLGLEEP